jgi:hypothetical protein
VKTLTLSDTQMKVLAALRRRAAKRGWHGEPVVVEGTLVYQIPLPNDPHVSGAFFAVEADELNIRLHLTLPREAPPARLAAASEFVIRRGYARRFGALELDLNSGLLRVRADTDATEDTIAEAVDRLLERSMALAREISPGWQAVCGGVTAETRQEGDS